MSVTKTVTPNTGAAFTDETFTYTMTIENTGTQDLNVQKIMDMLPIAFTYVAGSTTGYLTDDPSIQQDGSHQELKWPVSGSIRTIAPGVIWTLNFQANANVVDGIYENLPWLILEEDPPGCVSSGETAPIYISGIYDIVVTFEGVTVKVRVTRSADGSSVVIESWQVN